MQHRKYKTLLRWAHHALVRFEFLTITKTSEHIDKAGLHINTVLGKIQLEIEGAIRRAERLEDDDSFTGARKFNRPVPKSKEGTSLFVETTDKVRKFKRYL